MIIRFVSWSLKQCSVIVQVPCWSILKDSWVSGRLQQKDTAESNALEDSKGKTASRTVLHPFYDNTLILHVYECIAGVFVFLFSYCRVSFTTVESRFLSGSKGFPAQLFCVCTLPACCFSCFESMTECEVTYFHWFLIPRVMFSLYCSLAGHWKPAISWATIPLLSRSVARCRPAVPWVKAVVMLVLHSGHQHRDRYMKSLQSQGLTSQ